MKSKFVDCFLLMSTALSNSKLPAMNRPNYEATRINISVQIQDFRIINGENMEFQVDLLLQQQWFDPRLGANVQTNRKAVKGQIWKPKIINSNGIQQTCLNEDSIFWRGYGDEGMVILSERLIINDYCSKDFYKFPFDRQICYLKFATYRFLDDEVVLAWNDVILNSGIDDLGNFNLIEIAQDSLIVNRDAGNFSTLNLEFLLKRKSFGLLTTIITPNLLLTILNYLTLWMPSKLFLVRYLLNSTSLIYLFHLLNESFKIGSQFKLIDWFIMKTIYFSLMVLLEAILKDIDIISESLEAFVRTIMKTLFMILYFIIFIICYLYYID